MRHIRFFNWTYTALDDEGFVTMYCDMNSTLRKVDGKWFSCDVRIQCSNITYDELELKLESISSSLWRETDENSTAYTGLTYYFKNYNLKVMTFDEDAAEFTFGNSTTYFLYRGDIRLKLNQYGVNIK